MRAMIRQRAKSWVSEAAPAPMVLQFVEAVLTIPAVAVELSNGQNLGLQRGHQHPVFPGLLPLLVDLDKAEGQLALRLGRADHHPSQAATQQDEPPLPAPAPEA